MLGFAHIVGGGTLMSTLPPLSLYIHIPWCVRKCPYCDFNSHEADGEVPERRYVDALISDLDHSLPKIWGRRVYSIFFGGGTPSLFSARAIDEILAAVRARVTLDVEAEITLEACIPHPARVAELADARDLGSRGGSSPPSRTRPQPVIRRRLGIRARPLTKNEGVHQL